MLESPLLVSDLETGGALLRCIFCSLRSPIGSICCIGFESLRLVSDFENLKRSLSLRILVDQARHFPYLSYRVGILIASIRFWRLVELSPPMGKSFASAHHLVFLSYWVRLAHLSIRFRRLSSASARWIFARCGSSFALFVVFGWIRACYYFFEDLLRTPPVEIFGSIPPLFVFGISLVSFT